MVASKLAKETVERMSTGIHTSEANLLMTLSEAELEPVGQDIYMSCLQLLSKHQLDIDVLTEADEIILRLNTDWPRLKRFDYFTALQNSDMRETKEAEIQLDTIPLIHFIHTLEHTNADFYEPCELCMFGNHFFVFIIVEVATYLQDVTLLAAVEESLIARMDASVCYRSWVYASIYHLEKLKGISLRHILYHADFVIENHIQELQILKDYHPHLFSSYLYHKHINLSEKCKDVLEGSFPIDVTRNIKFQVHKWYSSPTWQQVLIWFFISNFVC